MAVPRRLTPHITIHSPLTRADLPGLYRRVCARLEAEDPVVMFCGLEEFTDADAVTVDALARLQLAGHRHGCEIRLCHASPALRELIALMGLSEVLALEPDGE
jgi:ABC-type transporter Mla MlaB component